MNEPNPYIRCYIWAVKTNRWIQIFATNRSGAVTSRGEIKMSKIEFDMYISGDVEETIDNQNVTNFKMQNYKFSKQNNESMNGEEATDAIVSMTNGFIRSIAPAFVSDEDDTYAVDEVVRIIVSKLALAVGVDPQVLMLAELRSKIDGKNNE